MPQRATVRISSMSAVSRKIFIVWAPCRSYPESTRTRGFGPETYAKMAPSAAGRCPSSAQRSDHRHPREQESMTPPEPSVLRLLLFTPSADDGYVDNALRSLARSLADLPLCSIAV